MIVDIVSLKAFYDSELGQKTSTILSAALKAQSTTSPKERIVGLGFVTPFLNELAKNADRALAFMPARQGAFVWPDQMKVATALVSERDLPLADASVDRVILVHMLEFAENAEELLNEVWRVLLPNGRVVIVVPHRRGLWARYENTPFGHGQPYSRQQLIRLLHKTNFAADSIGQSLAIFPSPTAFSRLVGRLFSTITERFLPFQGVLIVEATKRFNQPIALKKRTSPRIFSGALAPQTAPSLRK